MSDKIILFMLYLTIPITECAVPGTFFWKPRLGLDLALPTTEVTVLVNVPNKENLEAGLVSMIEGYQVGLTVIGFASGLSSGPFYPHLNPISAYYFTNVYRWALRYSNLVPYWLGGVSNDNFCDTHKVWRRRFHYADQFVPNWMRKMLFFVKKEEWEKEEREFKRYKKFAEPAFGKHYRYPSKKFDYFRKDFTKETADEPEISSSSLGF